jgi:molecular chaperone DnaK (HSP70)
VALRSAGSSSSTSGRAPLSDAAPPRLVGIDLGTTNSALAWTTPRGPLRIFNIHQLVASGETGNPESLPSFLYFPTDTERAAGAARLPWDASPDVVVGTFARDQGALVPSRQISSAKSWLSNPSVDRTARLLPWGADEGPKLSPVEASARVLAHIRDAWDHEHARGDPSARLETNPIVLTVPASFDEEARELTVQAARDAGFERFTLLEEPIAALYAWIAANRRSAATTLSDGALLLVCDVGGGTTDFSLMRASIDGGEVTFERVAIGEHLLLGGDNVDLALAVLIESRIAGGDTSKLSLSQRQMLRRKCSAAKEQLLSDAVVDKVRVTILGSGRGVVGGGVSVDLARQDVVAVLTDGFLPITAKDDLPARDRRVALRELGLPYEGEPAITRHLAAFLHRAGRQGSGTSMVRPDAVLFNGGFFTPAVVRQRVLDALARWFGERPVVLENQRPEAAVALGAAFYAKLRENPQAARRLLIRAGSARAYYIGVETAGVAGATTAVCVMPRGTQEGTTLALNREFTVVANQPAAFTLYSSTQRSDDVDELVTFTRDDEVHRHAPLVTALRYGKRSRRIPLDVRLTTTFTETGTLELWCESRTTEHRWRLSFNLRGAEADDLDTSAAAEARENGKDQVLITDEAVAAAAESIRAVFSTSGSGLSPEGLVGVLENVLGHGKQAWPLTTIRRLADVLLEVAEGRKRAPAFETRWFNLTGFCIRPGFGAALDAWRVSELRKVYAAGLAFPRDIQCQVEWLVLWQRVAAGFSAGHQRELAQRVSGQLGLGQRKPSALNSQIEREGWRLLGSLERLDPAQRARLGGELIEKCRRDPKNGAWLWAIGRFGARSPFYGPLNSVVAPATAEQWIGRLLALRQMTADAAAAVVQIGALTGDPARDISDEARTNALGRLQAAGVADNALEALVSIVTPDRVDAVRVFGESLPEGLRVSGVKSES